MANYFYFMESNHVHLTTALVDWITIRPLLLSAILFYFVYHLILRLLSFYSFSQMINKIPGPEFSSCSPLGHLNMFKSAGKLDRVACFFNTISGLAKAYEPKHSLIRLWLAVHPMIVIYKADAAERILSSNVHIQKAAAYQRFNPWLGTGLLTSWGKKWFQRRKMITPAFHFNILEAILPAMNEQANVLVDKLREKIDKICHSGSATIDVVPYLTYAALDVICETAMGVKIESQNNPNSDYVQAIHRAGNQIMDRYLKPWLWNDTLYFNLTVNGRQNRRDLKVLHEFTLKVIQERKRETMTSPEKLLYQQNNNNNTNTINSKRRLAFLDMLIEQHLKDPTYFTEMDMREEVDTFMFGGHDTTTVSMVWTLFLLGHHQDIQDRVQREIDHIWERDKVDKTQFLNSNQLREMKFLEACIKESLRLFPSAPYIARVAAEDIAFEQYIVPKDSTLFIFISLIQRDSKIFHKPDSFIPDRFIDGSEHYVKSCPFAYVPFSAGPRNCIGQKFALQEEKIILATVLRHFRLQSVKQLDNIHRSPEVVLRPKEPIDIRFTARN